MAAEQVKVVVGQTWTNYDDGGKVYTITRIDNSVGVCYIIRNGSEREFGCLDADGYPYSWCGDWQVVSSDTRVKVKPGQTYRSPNGSQYTISHVDNNRAYVFDLGKKSGETESFGAITKDGYPDVWGSWKLIEDSKEEAPKQIKANNQDALMAFFSQPQPGNCKCGMLKKECPYHRED